VEALYVGRNGEFEEKRLCRDYGRSGARIRKAKRDDNTEFTEVGTQRAQRRETQEHSQE
jgi:hypothetical protein